MEDVYDTEEGMKTATNGVFSSLASSGLFNADYWHGSNLTSGLMQSPRSGDKATIAAMNVPPNHTFIENMWTGHYAAIKNTNSFIDNVGGKSTISEVEHNELGQVLFVRSYLYFNIVRFWGKVPLKIGETTEEELFTGRTDRGKIYEQIIADADSAKVHFGKSNGIKTVGRPGTYAASMLLAKVYMALADADVDASYLQQDEVLPYLGLSSSECWALAEKEALEVINSGEFDLLTDYATLWQEQNRNSIESIFEIQYNLENAFNGKVWNIKDSYAGGAGFSRMRVTPVAVDEFVRANMVSTIDTPDKGTYSITGGDPRYTSTFKDKFYDLVKEKNYDLYPYKAGKIKDYPIIEKYAIKNLESSTDATNQNMIIYRYADLLLMLSEIENELDKPAEAITYVNLVISRARDSKNLDETLGDGIHPIDLAFTDKDAFRSEIFKQYRFELLGEGHDWFTNRRKGYDWFKLNTLDPHEAWPTRPNAFPSKEKFIKFIDTKGKVSLLPIILSEMNTNREIGYEDQNVDY